MRLRQQHLGFGGLLLVVGCAGGPPPGGVAPADEDLGLSRDTERAASQRPQFDTTIMPGRFDTGKMWTFENPPLDYFEATYDFRPSPEWLDHVRLAALRLPNCSASFVSASGLMMSNHHCARDGASEVTRDGEDLLEEGFYAADRKDERRVPGLHVDQLVEIRSVTEEIRTVVDRVGSERERIRARDRKIEEIEKRVSEETGHRCEVTSLYHGGAFSLYCYRRYDDVRLVFVPESQIGYFGGDPDNFTYPRYNLDVSFFRVYDDAGSPVEPDAYLRWASGGVREGDAVFVVGNPGSTSRLSTMAQLQYKRDHQYPSTLDLLESRANILERYMEENPDKRAEHINNYFSITNSLKAITGELKGLKTPELLGRKAAFERQFRRAVRENTMLSDRYAGAWDSIATLRRQVARVAPRLNGLNQGGILRSKVLATAASLYQYAGLALDEETPDSVLQEARSELDTTTIDLDLDRLILKAQIEDAIELLGRDDAFVTQALAGRPLDEAVQSLLRSTPVADSTRRAALLEEPQKIVSSLDPAMLLARDALFQLGRIVGRYRQLTGAEEAQTARLARALFEVYGDSIAPDATFTLRIADGVVAGYEYNGTEAPALTTFYGVYDRNRGHQAQDPWHLPARWQDPPGGFDLGTPLNLVVTNDIIGGNSGSPLVNTDGEVVGLIFDGNIESLPGDFIYTDETARAVAVHAEGIASALRDVYGAEALVDEILSGGMAP